MYKGIDVSKWQGKIDWEKVKQSEFSDFCLIRAGYGRNNIDPYAVQNIDGAKKNAIDTGLYWFSYAYTVDMARAEANYLLDFAFSRRDFYELPFVFDFEYASWDYANGMGRALTNKQVAQLAEAFCEEIENAGCYAMIYANYDYVKNKYLNGDKSIFDKYDLWYARYGETYCPVKYGETYCPVKYGIRQSSATGIIPGINGNVDLNETERDYRKIMVDNELNFKR